LSEAISYENLSREQLSEIMVAVIDAVLQHFQIEKLPMVASSFGGYLGLLYTLQRPENITKLILEGCPAMVEGMEIPAFMKMMLAPGLKWLMPKLPTPQFLFSKFMKEMGHTYSINHEQVPEVFLEWHVSLFNHTDTLKNDIALISKTMPGSKIHPAFILHDHEIEKITQPTLWLWGKEDAFGGIEIGQRLNAKMKNSSLISFDNCGHLPWVDTPQANAAEIKAFVGI
jgi:pimeloyl-ACP methyl ester carboxylesterase